jgi:hypothetical protein
MQKPCGLKDRAEKQYYGISPGAGGKFEDNCKVTGKREKHSLLRDVNDSEGRRIESARSYYDLSSITALY